ncbi:VCBS repeat-containing protein [Oxynema sp. CENA135]|uniref:rhamnogalacturonan lyase family protein n=1 Tax=Oxynema sp. CENA135 TaxID=984206 RepID=UPI00190C4DD9|nr:FG-GAP-like repeat-containing protein [Oxynema sp. CENA135]MBK4729870.1 VCBS repeat-containing protein [Oxynema sp. CENA135]
MVKKWVKTPQWIALAIASFLFLGALGLWRSRHSNTYTQGVDLPYAEIEPQTIALDLPEESGRSGGLIVADVNNDDRRDFLVTKPGYLAVYDNSGEKLWVKETDIHLSGKAETQGLPGLHAAGVQVGDLDRDGNAEVLFLNSNNIVHVVRGDTGETQQRITLTSPEGARHWEHLVIANFRGEGDRDLLLQATNALGYRMGRYLAAYAIEDLLGADNPQPLWTRDDFIANAHNGARLADLDNDGKHEVLGAIAVSPDGEISVKLPVKGHIDALSVADVRPDLPGLEVVALEEDGDNRVFLYNGDRLLWQTHYKHQEPQNTAVGEFDPDRPGLEIWARSRYNEDQKPFIFDANGELIGEYEMANVAPRGWTLRGVEVIFPIHWTGEQRELAAAKERHRSGDVALFEPISGKFVLKIRERADRLYVADVSGDWREEIIVLDGNRLRVYQNPDPNPNPDRPSLWTQDHYRRSKTNWNYYNP